MPTGAIPRCLARAFFGFVVLCSAIGSSAPSLAQELPRTIVIGEANTTDQRLELLTAFQASGPDNVDVVTADEAQQTLAGVIDSPSDGLGGAVFACGDGGTGLTVSTIGDTQIPPSIYALLLVSAGVADGSLTLAAPSGVSVDGLTPLAGIISALSILPCPNASTSPERIADAADLAGLTVALGRQLSPEDPRLGMESAVSTLLAILPLLPKDSSNLQATSEAISAGAEAVGVPLNDGTRSLLQGFLAEHPGIGVATGRWSIIPGSEPGSILISESEPEPTIAPTTPPTEPAATATEVPLTATPAPPTATPVPPTATAIPPTATPVPPTATPTLSPAQRAAIAVAETATAEAESTIAAAATATVLAENIAREQAAAAATKTATAPSPTPEPKPTIGPSSVTGTVISAGRSTISVQESGKPQATFRVDPDAKLIGMPEGTEISSIAPGEKVELSINAETGRVTRISVIQPSRISTGVIGLLLAGVIALAVIAFAILRRKKRDRSTFIVTQRGDS